MFSLIAGKRRPSVEHHEPGLLSNLVWLRGFGRPRIHSSNTGTWVAIIEMNTRAAGAQFEIRSDYLACPAKAVDQLIDRMKAMLEESPE